jgi:hypothetical protein
VNQEIVLLADQEASNARQVGKRAQEDLALTIDHVNPVAPGMGDEHAAPWAVDIRVVEAGSGCRWHLDELGADEAHTASTSFLHHA